MTAQKNNKKQCIKFDIYTKIPLFMLGFLLGFNAVIVRQLASKSTFCSYTDNGLIAILLESLGALICAFTLRFTSLINTKNLSIELLNIFGIAILFFVIFFLEYFYSAFSSCFVF